MNDPEARGCVFFVGLVFVATAIGCLTQPAIGCLVFGGVMMTDALVSAWRAPR